VSKQQQYSSEYAHTGPRKVHETFMRITVTVMRIAVAVMRIAVNVMRKLYGLCGPKMFFRVLIACRLRSSRMMFLFMIAMTRAHLETP